MFMQLVLTVGGEGMCRFKKKKTQKNTRYYAHCLHGLKLSSKQQASVCVALFVKSANFMHPEPHRFDDVTPGFGSALTDVKFSATIG